MERLIGLIRQLLKYQSTAIICGVIDYGLLIGLTEIAHLHYLQATVIALLTAMIVQYALNIRFVFDTAKSRLSIKFIGYAVLGVIGLGMNTMIVWAAVEGIGLHYIAGKVCASVIVGIYNFTSRKLYLEHIDGLLARRSDAR